MPHQYAEFSLSLKNKCIDFINKNLKEDFEFSSEGESLHEIFNRSSNNIIDPDKAEASYIFHMDRYLLFGKTMEDERVLSVIKKGGGLTMEEINILDDWEKQAFDSAFEIIDITKESIKIFDVVAEVMYEVYSNLEQETSQIITKDKIKHFLTTNLVPIKGVWFMSGMQSVLPPEVEKTIYEKLIKTTSLKRMYRNNSEKLQRAFDAQKKQYDKFVEFYGTDELVVPGNKLIETQQEYYSQQWLDITSDVYPPGLNETETVGIIMDEKEGELLCSHYGDFIKLFTDSTNIPDGWQDLVLSYLESETITAFVFRRAKEKYPESFRKIIKEAVDNRYGKNFDPVNDFEKLMDDYKPEWRKVYPSTHPINERFRKYTYQHKDVGRNDPCPCGLTKDDGTPVKYKRCCGR